MLLECKADVAAKDVVRALSLLLISSPQLPEFRDTHHVLRLPTPGRPQRGSTPLHCAVYSHRPACVLPLIAAGAPKDAPDDVRKPHCRELPISSLLRLSCSGIVAPSVHDFASYPPPPQTGRTPLHCAARQGYFDCLSLLLDSGADHSARDEEMRSTPLHKAAENGNLESVAKLLECGADIDAADLVRVR